LTFRNQTNKNVVVNKDENDILGVGAGGRNDPSIVCTYK
jgi:hypothetical protein